MSDLETLKEQHPAIQAMYDIAQRDGNRALPEELAVAALVTALQQHEATIAELNDELRAMGQIMVIERRVHEASMSDANRPLAQRLKELVPGPIILSTDDSTTVVNATPRPDLAAAQSTIQQLARQLEEAKAEAADWLKGADKWSKDTFMLMRERNEAQSERDAAQAELAKAQETIQQLARGLEDADEALIELFSAWIADDPFISDATTRAANKAKDRHSARAQQAEAKKEE